MNIFTKFSLKNTFVIFLIILMIIGGGIYSAKSINMESMPDVNIPQIVVSTVYPGAAPEDVAEKLSRPLQKSISGVKGVKSVKTSSNENISIAIVEFDYSQDMDKAEKDVETAVSKVTVPDNAQKPVVSRISFGSFPIMTYSINSNMNLQKLTQFVDNKLQPKLTGVSGVSSIDVQGTNSNNIYIKLDDQKLKDNNLTVQNIKDALAANNISIPAGQVDMNDKSIPIRVSKQVKSIDDIKSIPIVIAPNQTKIMGDAFNKVGDGMGQLSQGMSQLGSAVGQMGQGMNQLGQMVGGNTQAVAMLDAIQQLESAKLEQERALDTLNAQLSGATMKNDTATVAKLKVSIAQINGGIAQIDGKIKETQDSLNGVFTSMQQSANQAKTQSSTTPKTAETSKVSDNTQGNSSISPNVSISTVFLKDLANITDEAGERSFYTRSNYKDGIVLNIYKTDDANTVNVSKDVEDALKELTSENPSVKFNKINDSAKYVTSSVNGMVREGVLGAIFAIIVIAIFLKDIRATVIAIVSIPLSILIALILIPRFGITLNTMSLGGIAVAVGRIVDDSIVVIENIHRRIIKGDVKKEDLLKTATAEVASAITSSTITTVAVFLPLAFVTGIIGKIFVPFAYTVVICILASLLMAVTVVPVMSKYLILNKKVKHVQKENKAAVIYQKVLNGALNHRALVIMLALALLVCSFGLISKVGVQFMPSETPSVLNGKITMQPGTSLSKTNDQALKFENYLKGRKDVDTVVSSIGDTSSSGNILSSQSENVASFTIILKDGYDKEKATNEIEGKANTMNNKEEAFTITPQSTMGGGQDNINIVVKGNSLDDITKAANKITDSLKGVANLSNLTNSLSQKKPEISVNIDNEKAAQKGITPIMAAGIVRGLTNYDNVMTLQDGNRNVNVLMGYNKADLDSIDKVKAIKIQGMGEATALGDIADVKLADGPVSISELDGTQYASITADIKGKDTSKVSKEVTDKIDAIKGGLPKGVTYSDGGSTKSIQDGFSQMGMAMLVAVFMVYIIMVLAFGEPKAPFAILFSLPFAAVGAGFALFITNQPLTMPGLIGMLMLIGIVVTNAIVLLDRVQTNRKNGMNVREALLEAGSVRLRPIFMTAIATVMALMPLALGFSEGAVISQGLGIIVIGGLVVSTALTLIIVPVMYSILERDKKPFINKNEEENYYIS
jgi:HAE1 family hydrophobic/amphiphilic exporter-1